MLALTCLKTCYGNVSNGIGVPFLVFFSFTNKVILKLTQKGYPGPFYQSLREKRGQQVLSLSSGLVERYGKDQRKPCLLSQGKRKLASSTEEVSKQLRGRKWEVGLQRIREKNRVSRKVCSSFWPVSGKDRKTGEVMLLEKNSEMQAALPAL